MLHESREPIWAVCVYVCVCVCVCVVVVVAPRQQALQTMCVVWGGGCVCMSVCARACACVSVLSFFCMPPDSRKERAAAILRPVCDLSRVCVACVKNVGMTRSTTPTCMQLFKTLQKFRTLKYPVSTTAYVCGCGRTHTKIPCF